jgi:hypothetical protein
MFLLQVPKGKEREEKKEAVYFWELIYLSSFIHSCNIPILVMSPYCNILLFTEFCKDNVYCVDDQ